MFNLFQLPQTIKKKIVSFVGSASDYYQQYKRLLSTSFMFLFIGICYACGRRTKDVIIGERLSMELTGFIKPFVILPATIFVVMIYNYLSNRINKRTFTYVVNIPFLSIFIIYIICELMRMNGIACVNGFDIDFVPYAPKFAEVFAHELSIVVKNVLHVSLYVFTEFYGTVVLSFAFWRYVNEFTTVEQAKTDYPVYLFFSSISNCVSGLLGESIARGIRAWGIKESTNFAGSLFTVLNLCCCISAIFASLFFYRISYAEMMKQQESISPSSKIIKKKKVKHSLMESIKTLFRDKKVLCLTVTVLCYMAIINLVEVSWKRTVQKYFLEGRQDRIGYNSFFSRAQLVLGIMTVVPTILSKVLLQHFSWKTVSMLNPIVIGIGGVIFFMFKIFGSKVASSSLVVLKITLLIGLIQNIASKSFKYSFFDSTKEIAFLHIDHDVRDRGKAAVDMLGGRAGKGLGSFIQQMLLFMFVSKEALFIGQDIIAPYIMVIVVILSIIWIGAVIILGNSIAEHKFDSEDELKSNDDKNDDEKTEQNTAKE